MSDNALNLMVKFTGVDKLSGSIRNIVGAGKAGSDSVRSLQREIRTMERDLAKVHRQMAKGGGAGLTLAERELTEALRKANKELSIQQGRIARLQNIQGKAGAVAGFAGVAGAVASVAVTAPLVAFGKAAFTAAMDAEELRSAFFVTFGDNGAMMERWAQKTGGALNRTSFELMQSANTFGIFFNQADPKKAAALSQQFAVLAQDLSSFYNVDPGTALEKLRSGLTGESEPMRDFGVFLTEAAVKAQALKMGLKPLNGELTEQQKIMARASLIMEQTKAAQGDLVRTSGSTANQLRASQTAWQNLSLVVGRDLIPALMPAIQTITGLIQAFSGLSPGMRKFIVIAGIGAAVVGPLLLGISGVAGAIGMIIPLLPALGAAFAVLTGPVGLFVAVIAGLAYAVYANWDKIKAAFASGVAWVKGVFAALPGWFSGIGGQLMMGLLSSLSPAVLATRLVAIARQGVIAFRNYFGIKSPSRLMMQMGGHMASGLALGIDGGARRPLRSMGRMAAGVAGAGALSLAGPSLAATAGARGGAQAAPVEIKVYQQPGEDGEALARRVAELVERQQRSQRRGSFGDDF